MIATRVAAALFSSALVAGCGTAVPNIAEFPADAVGEQQFVQKIVQNVTCEVRDAVNNLYRIQNRKNLFLDTWGAQITLNLTIAEKSAVNPSAGWAPNPIFSLIGGVELSSEATRVNTINSYYTIKQIRGLKKCDPQARKGGGMLLSSDLKLENLLFSTVLAGDTKQVDFNDDARKGPQGEDVISHRVKFVVTSSGSATPAWVLSRVFSVNPGGGFLSAQRSRTHDLTITLGPTDDSGKEPSRAAANVALSAQIGVAISNSIRQGVLP